MPNYFDYISEAANSSVDVLDDFDDMNDVYNEMDATMCEFDSYIQESVGVKILIGIGIAAALGGLIALIIKLFSGKSTTSATTKAVKAKAAVNRAEKKGVKAIQVATENNVPVQKVINDTKEQTKNTVDTVNEYKNFVERYFDSIATYLEGLVAKYPDKSNADKRLADLNEHWPKLFDQMLDDFPHLKGILGARTKRGAKDKVKKFIKLESARRKAKETGNNAKIEKAENAMGDFTADLLSGAAGYVIQTFNIADVKSFVDNTLRECKNLLFSGQELNKYGKRFESILKKGGVTDAEKTLTTEEFNKLTAVVTNLLNSTASLMSDSMDAINASVDASIENPS